MPAESGHRIRRIELIDTQSGGDVSRIVLAGVDALPGKTVREQMRYLEKHGDGLRRLLLSEPYGDPHMSVNLVIPPCHPEAEAGYIIMEAMGYPMYSGSNTICTATAALESGRIPMEDGSQSMVLESPAGLSRITAECRNGRVQSVTTQGEPAYVAERDNVVDVPLYGTVSYDIVWSGCFYAVVDACEAGFSLTRDEEVALAAFGEAFIRAACPQFAHEHPEIGDAGALAFMHMAGSLEQVGTEGFRSRSATYVHPGVICRSPTGTGTSARLALMTERGEIHEGQWLDTVSPRDSDITGRARTLAHSQIVIDLDDPLVEDGGLSAILSNSY